MRRTIHLFLALTMLAAACGGDGAPAPSSTTAAPTTTTTTTAPTTTSTSVVTESLSTVSCDQAPAAFAIFCEAVDLVRERYVDEVSDAEMAAAAGRGLVEFAETEVDDAPLTCALPGEAFLAFCETFDALDPLVEDGVEAALDGLAFYALDPNSMYLDPEELAITEESQSGTVEGIGALVTTEDETAEDPRGAACRIVSDTCHVVIVSALPGSPAERAGIRAGDEIVAVDGEGVTGLTFDQVTTNVRGPAGTDVTLTLDRGGTEILVTITRAAIEVPVVESEMIGDTAYLRLNFFTTNAHAQVHDALRELLAFDPDRLVLDLRDNPGGALTAAVAVTSEFLSEGLVLRTEAPGQDRPYEVEPGGLVTDPSLEVVVLVNRGSASASEVVTGALKEAGRAIVIGEATFGKNTVQQRFALSNGGAFKVTIARWVTPSGTDFGGTGIAPDIEAELPADLTSAELVDRVDRLVG